MHLREGIRITENPALAQRRPAIDDVPLDTDNTYTVVPYLDIVNEVLAASLDTADTFKKLRSLRYPATLPFVRHDERVRLDNGSWHRPPGADRTRRPARGRPCSVRVAG